MVCHHRIEPVVDLENRRATVGWFDAGTAQLGQEVRFAPTEFASFGKMIHERSDLIGFDAMEERHE